MQKIREILGAQAAPTDHLLEWKCTACEEVFKVFTLAGKAPLVSVKLMPICL